MYPYGSETRDGENVALRIRILNHAPTSETYHVKWNVPAGWKVVEAEPAVTVPARREGMAEPCSR